MSVSAEGFMIVKKAILTSEDDSQDPYFGHLLYERDFWDCPFSTRGPLAEPPLHKVDQPHWGKVSALLGELS